MQSRFRGMYLAAVIALDQKSRRLLTKKIIYCVFHIKKSIFEDFIILVYQAYSISRLHLEAMVIICTWSRCAVLLYFP